MYLQTSNYPVPGYDYPYHWDSWWLQPESSGHCHLQRWCILWLPRCKPDSLLQNGFTEYVS